jgi:hypothetical protein
LQCDSKSGSHHAGHKSRDKPLLGDKPSTTRGRTKQSGDVIDDQNVETLSMIRDLHNYQQLLCKKYMKNVSIPQTHDLPA